MLCSLGLIASFALIASHARATCFNFENKLTEPLNPPLVLKGRADASSTGSKKNGVQWGAVRAIVKRPIRELLKKFEDPYLTKNPKNTVITKKVMKSPHYLWIRKMHLEVKPVFFVTVEWDEQWAVAVREGKEAEPKSFIVYYQKIAGTSHIDHLCGNIVVTTTDEGSSDVYLYEEVKSSHWSGEDAAKNFQMVVKIFRGEHSHD